jgi:hypothetical protein
MSRRSEVAERDGSVLMPLPAIEPTDIELNMKSAPSYDCCETTVTKGPGCCERAPQDSGELADRIKLSIERSESERLWPLAVS